MLSLEGVTIKELRARGRVIEHPPTPNNILFKDSKPCPQCKTRFFSCSADLEAHQKVCDGGWRKSNFKENEKIRPAEEDPQLALTCKQNGKVEMNGFIITLSNNRKWLKRRKL